MKTQFNLVTDEWLPVVGHDGQVRRVGLARAFDEGTQWRDLHVRPHERIALMRLLICVAQRALDGPADFREWSKLGTNLDAGLAKSCSGYLHSAKIKPLFNLLGEGLRFLQLKGLGQPGRLPAFKLIFVDEKARTLFDQHAVPGEGLTFPDCALALLTFQSFAAGGTVGGSALSPNRQGEIKRQPQKGLSAPCRESAAIHAFLLAQNLLETVHLNLLTKEQVNASGFLHWRPEDKPTWELCAVSLKDLSGEATGLGQNYLSRLAPCSRSVWLEVEPNTNVISYAQIANGVAYPLFRSDPKAKKGAGGHVSVRELTVSVIGRLRGGKEQDELVSAKGEAGMAKAIWRELHALAVLRRGQKRSGPAALENLYGGDGRQPFRLWTGAFIGDQGSVADVVEGEFTLPIRFLKADDAVSTARESPAPLEKANVNSVYRAGVGLAQHWQNRLTSAVSIYRRTLKDKLEGRQPRDQVTQRGNKIKGAACLRFWALLEPKASAVLMPLACDSAPYMKGDKVDWPSSPWGHAVLAAAREAFTHACPHDTPGQLRAYAGGLHALFAEKEEAGARSETNNETEEET
jgi:CRISPR system Cascade subunit CasA